MPAEQQLNLSGPVGQLQARYFEPAQANAPLVVVCHPHPLYQGTMDNKVVHTLVKSFSELGCATIRFNYRGVGDSDGEYDEGIGETEDAMAMVAWGRWQWQSSQLWLVGFSFGSFVAARAASLIQTQQLLTVAPAVTRFDFNKLEPVTCPWWVIQGESDDIVDPHAVIEWVNQHNHIELTTLPEVGHFFHGQLTRLKQLVQAHYQVFI